MSDEQTPQEMLEEMLEAAWNTGYAAAMERVRAEGFAALRRAAAVARDHDQRAAFYTQQVLRNATPKRLACDDCLIDVESGAQSIWNHVTCARSARRAIREAIGSDNSQ